ncbi:MmcQ/YjbR family DNA-binding protein [Methylobacterium sp. E-025]|nr:MmcQ/YjbR family DNA-binding protein [Methylobacterium sp. E-025]
MLPEDVRALALMLPEAILGAHKGNPDFRVGGRVFATLWTEEDRLVLRLSPEDQERLLEAEPDLFSAIDGAWGRRGWTNLDLDACEEEILRDALLAAWRATAPAGLVSVYEPTA